MLNDFYIMKNTRHNLFLNMYLKIGLCFEKEKKRENINALREALRNIPGAKMEVAVPSLAVFPTVNTVLTAPPSTKV